MSKFYIVVEKLNMGWRYYRYWWKVRRDGSTIEENGSFTRVGAIRKAERSAKKLSNILDQRAKRTVYEREFES